MAISSRKYCTVSVRIMPDKTRRQTNSAKPTFVFWSLIALPTLTVLIGAIGDVVSDFVNWYTNWIGTHTVNIWRLCKALFAKEDKAEKVKQAAKTVAKEHEKSAADKQGTAKVSNGFDQIAELEGQMIVPKDVNLDGLTEMEREIAQEKYKPFMLLKAAQHILSHLDATPPRKYNFQEWTWLLKLLGEDETDEEGHRRVGQPLAEGKEIVTPVRKEKHQVWSWLGQESPLMSLEEGTELSKTFVLWIFMLTRSVNR